MKRRTRGEKGWKRLLPWAYVLFVLLLYFSLLSEPTFTDEQDVLFGGYNIAHGQDLYRSYLSQHMPFSYYFAALPALLGARTVFQYRVWMYLLMTLVWGVLYRRNRKDLPELSLWLMPLLYLAGLKTVTLATTMITEHWQGLGLLIIGLELFRYARTREISPACAGMIALGIALSFGSIFVAVYSVFCLFLAALGLQISFLRREPEAGRAIARKKALREDARLLAFCLAPFLLLGGWYALTGNLKNCWEGAYEINVTCYAQYASIGSSALELFWKPFVLWGGYLLRAAQSLGSTPVQGILKLLQATGLVLFCLRAGRKSPAAAVAFFCSAIYTGTREFDHFHGMAYYAHTGAAIALLLGEAADRRAGKPLLRGGALAVSGVTAVILLLDFGYWDAYNLLYPQPLGRQPARAEELMLDLLTDPHEQVHSCDTPSFSQMIMNLELLPQDACDAVSIRWYYDMWKDRQLASLRKNPAVVLYNPTDQIWGFVFHDYAVEFEDYLNQNYTHLAVGENIWVWNGFLPETEKRLAENGYGSRLLFNADGAEPVHPVEFGVGQSVEQTFMAEGKQLNAVLFEAACFYQRRRPVLRLEVANPETGEVLGEGRITAERVADSFFSRCPLRAELIPGQEYQLKVTVESLQGRGNLGLFFSDGGQLCIGLEYLD